jgi:hypothetical protein
MAQNKNVRFGPIALTNAVANLFNPGTLTGGVNMPSGANLYFLIKHIRIVNKTAGAVTCTFYIGATGGSAAGTEVIGNGLSVAANSYIDVYPVNLRLDVADFLTGLASANTSLVLQGEGEIGVA